MSHFFEFDCLADIELLITRDVLLHQIATGGLNEIRRVLSLLISAKC